MAYLHCHSCGWSQDDFWDFSFGKRGYWWRWQYNPLSCFMSHVFTKRGLWKPRRIEHDAVAAEEYGWKRNDPHSWYLVWWQFRRMLRKLRHQTWQTNKSWQKHKATAVCPSCGERNFDID